MGTDNPIPHGAVPGLGPGAPSPGSCRIRFSLTGFLGSPPSTPIASFCITHDFLTPPSLPSKLPCSLESNRNFLNPCANLVFSLHGDYSLNNLLCALKYSRAMAKVVWDCVVLTLLLDPEWKKRALMAMTPTQWICHSRSLLP